MSGEDVSKATEGVGTSAPDMDTVVNANVRPTDATAKGPVFFPVSTRKLAIMSFVSFGLYEMWWMFKNWKYIQQSSGRKIAPAGRAFFGVLWVYPLLKEIQNAGKSHGLTQRLDTKLVALGWIILTVLWRLPDPWWMVTILSFVPLLEVQNYINALNKAINPECEINDKFTKGNWAFIVIGSIILFLDVLGMFLPS